MIVLTTSTLMTGVPCYPENEFLAFDTRFESKKIEKKMNDGLDSHDSHDGHDAAMYQEVASYTVVTNAMRPAYRRLSHPKNQCPSSEDRWINPGNPRNGHSRFFTPLGQAGKVLHLRQCRHTVCREGTRLEDLHGCRSLADNQAGRTLQCKGIYDGGPRGQ